MLIFIAWWALYNVCQAVTEQNTPPFRQDLTALTHWEAAVHARTAADTWFLHVLITVFSVGALHWKVEGQGQLWSGLLQGWWGSCVLQFVNVMFCTQPLQRGKLSRESDLTLNWRQREIDGFLYWENLPSNHDHWGHRGQVLCNSSGNVMFWF